MVNPAHSPREKWRFPTALGTALAVHALLFATWETLPFASALEQSPIPDEGLSSLAVQLVAPPPPPPAPTQQPEPTAPRREAADDPPKRSEGNSQSLQASEQDKPEPTPEPVITAEAKTTPKVAPVEKSPPPRPVAAPPPKPPTPKPPPTPPATRTVSKPPAPAPAASSPPAPPSYRSNPKPPYPSDARRARAQGVTYLRVEILSSGKVGKVSVIKSSGHASLDAAARNTVSSRWRFHPARRGGKAVPAIVTVPVRFQLR